LNPTAWSNIVDICGITGLPVGIVGLLITIKTFYEAKKAKDAALQASEIVWRKDAASDFNEISQRAQDLLRHVQGRQSDLATLRATDLVHSFEIAFGRWRDRLPSESVSRLNMIKSQVTSISHSLTVESIPQDPALFGALSGRCHTILRVLSEEAGRVHSNAETVDHA
jgi:hypothetical protein